MKPFLINLSLLLTAATLALISFPFCLLYSFWKALVRRKPRQARSYLAGLGLAIAISIDMLGNVVGADVLNDLLIHADRGYRFGNQKETISRVLGKNKARGTLTKAGRMLADLLNRLDPDHVERAADDTLFSIYTPLS